MDHYPLMMYRHDTDSNMFHFHGHTHITGEQDWVEKWTRELVTIIIVWARPQVKLLM